VRITHGNLAHNLRVITTSLGAGPHTVVASWLPQYHDMGLIGSYLGVVACGGAGVYMSPLTFLKNPLAWITAMSKYKATHVQAPNFAYALTARRWRDLPPKERATAGATLNLAPLRHAFNAAEAVTTGAIADFCAAFTPYGLSPKAFSPGYGLAENTVYVSDGGRTVVWVDRESLEEEGRVVLALVSRSEARDDTWSAWSLREVGREPLVVEMMGVAVRGRSTKPQLPQASTTPITAPKEAAPPEVVEEAEAGTLGT
jgi:acyl-CoA synthetase (AMP-forming)/AMP-acid ligase II